MRWNLLLKTSSSSKALILLFNLSLGCEGTFCFIPPLGCKGTLTFFSFAAKFVFNLSLGCKGTCFINSTSGGTYFVNITLFSISFKILLNCFSLLTLLICRLISELLKSTLFVLKDSFFKL